MDQHQAKKPLRSGYTTGACATAATKAALWTLLSGEKIVESTIFIPAGEFVRFHIEYGEVNDKYVTAGTVKDGGDDPDATHGALIQATVCLIEERGVVIDGGIGVGRVTKPGLPIAVGEAAINPVPRQMITEVCEELLQQFGLERGVRVVISVPTGEEVAKKTLNGRLGILGGISILGTRGIVVPFSNEAYTASITQALKVACAAGCDTVVLTTGGRSEKYAMKQYPELPEEAFIEMGDFIGYTLSEIKRLGISHVKLVGMMGKLSKVAQGKMNVHAHAESIDFTFLAKVAQEAGASQVLVAKIHEANTASQVGEWMRQEQDTPFFHHLCRYACKSGVSETNGAISMETSLYTLQGEPLGRASVNGYEQSETDRNRCRRGRESPPAISTMD